VRVPFADLTRATAALRSEIDDAVARVLDRGSFVLGEEGRAFEAEFCSMLGVEHAVGVASGTDAIEVSLRALEIGPGDEVVSQANTCIPTISGIERTGARPVLCDVDPATGTIDPGSLRSVLTSATRAIVPVHLYGQCADMDRILEIAAEHGVFVVEDCAQAHLAQFGDRVAGTIGTLGAFSFYPTKNLGALGDAGAVVTRDAELAERLRLVRQYGQASRYEHVTRGVNSRLDELQAAILRAKLPRLPEANRRRAEIAATYDAALSDSSLRPLERTPGAIHAFHLYVVRTSGRQRVQEALEARGVQTLIHYPQPVHGQPGYADLAYPAVDLGNAELLAREVLSLPLFPDMSDDEVAHVARAAAEVARGA
jgi:dTDP-3-amino-3,4,6-trideoxy-alpha-D-glucose transaminase